ncbi:Ig-like domain-containing protein [Candidatus Roizmanbacteria bacterium]|nr:Ig-like domain-containing protein [Candidatus Roizmanbacteria bacterium]
MDKKLLGLMSVFFLAFLLFTTVLVFRNPIQNVIRAEKTTQPSGANSLIFAWPLTTNANGQSEVKIDVFVRNGENKPLQNRQVSVASTLGTIKAESAQSDQAGKTTFLLTSDAPGIAEITATIDNSTAIEQKLTVKFE